MALSVRAIASVSALRVTVASTTGWRSVSIRTDRATASQRTGADPSPLGELESAWNVHRVHPGARTGVDRSGFCGPLRPTVNPLGTSYRLVADPWFQLFSNARATAIVCCSSVPA